MAVNSHTVDKKREMPSKLRCEPSPSPGIDIVEVIRGGIFAADTRDPSLPDVFIAMHSSPPNVGRRMPNQTFTPPLRRMVPVQSQNQALGLKSQIIINFQFKKGSQ